MRLAWSVANFAGRGVALAGNRHLGVSGLLILSVFGLVARPAAVNAGVIGRIPQNEGRRDRRPLARFGHFLPSGITAKQEKQRPQNRTGEDLTNCTARWSFHWRLISFSPLPAHSYVNDVVAFAPGSATCPLETASEIKINLYQIEHFLSLARVHDETFS